MADNTTLPTSDGGGDTYASDDIGGVKYARSKIVIGADGTNDGDVSSANPLPVGGTILAAIQTAVEIIDNAISGSEMQVDLVSANVTNEGTFAVQVDGDALTALQLLDDAVYTTATGTPSKGLAVMGTDGTNPRLVSVDSSGHVQIDVLSSALPSGAATSAKQDTLIGHVDGVESSLADAVTALQIMDDWDETNRAKVNLIVGQAGITAGAGAVGASTPRVTLASDDPAVALLGTIDTDTGNIATAAAAIQTAVEIIDNAISGSEMQVDLVSANVTNAGTFAVQVDGDALTALQLIDDPVFADDAAFTADTSKVMVAGAVRDDEVGGTAVVGSDGDVAPLRIDKLGNLKTTQIHDATSEIKYAAIDVASSGNNTLVAAVGAGVKIRVLSVFLVAAGTVNVRFESGADGTALTGQVNLVVNTGFVLPFNPGGWFETADNTLLNLELSAGVSVDGCISYVEV